MISDDLLTEFTRRDKGFFDRLLKWNINSQYVAGKFIGFIPKVTFPLIRYEPYPEITGHGVSLFSKLYKVFKKEEYLKRAVLASNAIVRMQLPSGAFKFLLKEDSKEAIFDSLMMINGLIDFYEVTSEEDVFKRAIIALERVPDYIAAMDIGVIPFDIMSPTAYYAAPNKLWEYLSQGVNVISTPIPEALAYKHLIDIAWSEEDYIATMQDAGRKISVEKDYREIRRYIEGRTWSKSAERFKEIISKLITCKR